jgi:hypothetical protein
MRVMTSTTVLETSGVLAARRSTIEMSAKTFRMQIDEMYSNKIESIVREITANGFDSHARAKQDKPFYVHAPDVLDPTFYVRDYGVGMSDETMGEVYIVLGKSDKDKDNREVGMWGLGSKSPFAYNGLDIFYITCFDGQEARHYGYAIAEDGVPTLYTLEVTPSDEPRGVRVGFAVDPNDFAAFAAAIKKIAFAHRNGFESNIPLPDMAAATSYTGDGWVGYVGEPLGLSGAQWLARQGCVLYPIDAATVKAPSVYSHQKAHVFVIDCPIGTVQVTPNRESIQYRPEVIEFLKGRIDEVKQGLIAAVWDQVKEIEDVVEFFKKANELTPTFATPHNFIHPLTKLTSPNLAAPNGGLFFEAEFTAHGRWTFTVPQKLELGGRAPEALLLIDNVAPLYDPSRIVADDPDRPVSLSKSELRRVSRFVRAFLEACGEKRSLLVFGSTWDDAFLKACLPRTSVVRLPFEKLRDAVPRRTAPPTSLNRQPIRGLALAKAAGEQKPVFEITPPTELVAWVTSDQYRAQSAGMFKLARGFQVQALYIAAPQVEHLMVEAKVPHLKLLIEETAKGLGADLVDWWAVSTKVQSAYGTRNFIDFLRDLSAYEKAYDSFAKAKGAYCELATLLRPMLPVFAAPAMQFGDEERRTLSALLNPGGTSPPPALTPTLVRYQEIVRSLASTYENPTVRFVDGLTAQKGEGVCRIAKALVQLQKIIPPDMKLKAR